MERGVRIMRISSIEHSAGRRAGGFRPLLVIAVLGIFLLGTGPAWAMSNQERINQATQVVREMSNQSDTGTMASLLRSAKGVAIFPSVFKAALGFGGRHGEGLILRHDAKRNRWYGPSFVDISGASWGLQIGVETTALMLIITNERGMAGFTGDNVTLGGNLSVAAGPVGRSASAATNLTASIYSYSMSKGLFAGISLGGAVVDTRQDKNREYWKKNLSSGRILKIRATNSRIRPLLGALNSLLKK
jgi:lipid-binding SYLF domain-containing protein